MSRRVMWKSKSKSIKKEINDYTLSNVLTYQSSELRTRPDPPFDPKGKKGESDLVQTRKEKKKKKRKKC